MRVEEGQQDQQVGQALTRLCWSMKPALPVQRFNEQSLFVIAVKVKSFALKVSEEKVEQNNQSMTSFLSLSWYSLSYDRKSGLRLGIKGCHSLSSMLTTAAVHMTYGSVWIQVRSTMCLPNFRKYKSLILFFELPSAPDHKLLLLTPPPVSLSDVSFTPDYYNSLPGAYNKSLKSSALGFVTGQEVHTKMHSWHPRLVCLYQWHRLTCVCSEFMFQPSHHALVAPQSLSLFSHVLAVLYTVYGHAY